MTAQLSSFPTEAGVFPDVPEDVYHRAGAYLSSTGSRTLAKRTPAHFRYEVDHGRKPKTSYDIGTAAHALLLGRGADVIVLDYDSWNTKESREKRDACYAAGQVPLLPKQRDEVDAMVDAVRADPIAGKLFARTDCQPEVTVVGQDPETGVWCRARIDWLLPVHPDRPVTFVDAKTMGEDADERGLVKAVSSWSYHAQIDHYADCLRWALDLDPDHPVNAVLVAVEKEPPHLTNIGGPDEESLRWAHEDNRKARHVFARCAAENRWPGHERPDGEPLSLALPGWLRAAYESTYGRPGDDSDQRVAGCGGVFDPDIYFADEVF